jgi:3-demethoxyubiquinol 3-hydroxylase
MSFLDALIGIVDEGLRACAMVNRSARPSPSHGVADAPLDEQVRAEAAALMRVNHAGEVCAQALYAGQAITARSAHTRDAMEHAAREEEDHLAWSAQRIRELGGRPSLLNPLWYAGSFAIGAAAGALGDRWNLAFLAETERQVEQHLDRHLQRLSADDARTRAVVQAMRDDEARHRQTALQLGAVALPVPVYLAMRVASRVMTTVAHRI